MGVLIPLLLSAASSCRAQPSPNFVIILTDDQGCGDVGCYGAAHVSTPRIDRMAREGARFTDFYAAAPFCSPSRAALLTGRLPARCGVPYVLFPTEHHGLPPGEITLAALLKSNGYATACIGKWHLGWDKPFRPSAHGFDAYFGLPHSNDLEAWEAGRAFTQLTDMEPLQLMDGDRVAESPVDQSTLTRRYTERAVKFIRQNRDRPFFLYLPHTMPHAPKFASATFAGKTTGGLDTDVLAELDWSAGAILDALAETGIADRTLVIYLSDNGAPVVPPAMRDKGPHGKRGNGGSNSPLRGGKGATSEGGIRVPAICWWPGRIPAGTTLHAPASALDLFPTLAALAGVPLPKDRVYDGRDLSAWLSHPARLPEERPLFHYFGLQLQAMRFGRWKLLLPVAEYPDARSLSLWFEHQPQVFERQHRLRPSPALYDLHEDIGETRDLADQNPALVQKLISMAKDFDAALQRDKRPTFFVEGPKPPKPGQVQTAADDLNAWRQFRAGQGNIPAPSP